ncbi:MAG TPA: FliM/FliN family flagellar motor switch protein [Lacipirellula sp.]
MSELTPDMAASIAAACTAGADEAAAALGRALGGEFKLTVGEPTPLVLDPAPAGFDGAALVVLLHIGGGGVAIALPQASGLVPPWCAAPDASGDSRLATLAQELGALLLPESLPASEFKARVVDHLGAAVKRAHLSASATFLPLEVQRGEETAQLSLMWPLEAPAELFATEAPISVGAGASAHKETDQPSAGNEALKPRDLTSLPNYLRSLLKISVPVSVQLASKKESVGDVVGLAPGSIIKFDKGCEELLQMIVGEHTVAEGEAVKIGEKFGFRVIAMKLPPEHFVPVKKKPQQRRRA